ncbi:unnamed protein product [Gemmataceae bacterium]|nr:unnamed protein product [Gemmataceae bacterium]VTU00721.1 unnamed protein product [Gemmataceae bacterium]
MPKATKRRQQATGSNRSPVLPEVLTIDEAAAFLRVPAIPFRSELESGQIHVGRCIAGEWRFTVQGIVAWLSCDTRTESAAR